MPAAILCALLLVSLAAMLYGLLRLDRTRTVILAGVVLVVYGTVLYMLIDAGHPIGVAAAWTQIGALALALGGFVYASGLAQGQRERLAESRRRLHDLQLDADARASRDTLTGVYHHRHLMDALEREIARAERIGKPLSIARVDLDWQEYVRVDPALQRGTAELHRLVGNPAKARAQLGWEPEVDFTSLVHLLVDADLARLQAPATSMERR